MLIVDIVLVATSISKSTADGDTNLPARVKSEVTTGAGLPKTQDQALLFVFGI